MRGAFLSFAFDAFLVLSLFIILTGASPFLLPLLTRFFQSNPKWHRFLLANLTFINFAAICTLHYFGKLDHYSNVARFVRHLRISPWTWTWVLYIFLAAVFACSSMLRHHVFLSSFDFAIFAQAVWNTWTGSFLYSSIKGGVCLLGDHVSPILAILAPIYGLTGEPSALLFTQAVVAASSIFPIYLIAKDVLKSERIAFCFAISFAVYLPIRNAVRFDFHPELLGDPLLLWAFYFILRHKLVWASLTLALVLTTKETACAPIAMLGLYSWWFRKKKEFGIVWFFIAVTVFIVDVKIIAPHFYGGNYFYAGNYLSWFQKGPIPFIQHLFQGSTFTYLKKVFLPVGFLSFLSPSTLLLTAPILFQNLAGTNTSARSTFFQYTAFLTPFVFVSAIYGFKKVMEWGRQQQRWPFDRVKLILIYWFLGSSLLLAGVSEFYVMTQFLAKDSDHFAYVRRYLKTVPSSVSVRTHEFFAAHLANRRELHIYENHYSREGGSQKALNSEYVILDASLLGDGYERHLEELRQQGYRSTHVHDGFFVFQKDSRLQ